MNQYKKFLGRTDLVKNQVEREKLAEQEAASKRKRRIQEANRRSHLRYQEQLRSELAARYFHAVQSTGGDADTFSNTYSVALDGTDEYVDCGDNDNLSFGDTSNDFPFTFSVWAKVDDLNSSHSLIEKQDASNNREYVFFIGSDGAI